LEKQLISERHILMTASPKSILIIEDETNIQKAIEYNLVRAGYKVYVASDGEEGLNVFNERKPNLLILDLMLPELDGLEVCKIIRSSSNVPILMLTAKGEEIDRVVGLEIGADDYLVKPFGMHELLARVKAILRRVNLESENSVSIRSRNLEKTSDVLISGNLVLDAQRHRSSLDQVELDLKPREFQLLFLFMSNVGLVLTRNKILDELWGQEFIGDLRSVDVHVRWLRVKLEDDSSNPKRLVTIRGVGYRFEG